MYLIDSLNKQKGFTDIQRRLAVYALKNLNKISHMTIKEYANDVGVSEASIVRFCKQLGIKGFKEFKLELNKEIILKGTKEFNIVHRDNLENITIQDIFYNTLELDGLAVSQLVNTLSLKNIENASEVILKKHSAVIYGAGASAIVADDLGHKLTKLGIAVSFNRDFHYMLSHILNMEAGDAFIAVSTTGETEEVLELVELAKQQGAVIISITTLQKSLLVRETDIPLFTPVLEESFRVANMATRISQLAVVDILYMNLYKALGNDIIDKFYELRDAVTKYRR